MSPSLDDRFIPPFFEFGCFVGNILFAPEGFVVISSSRLFPVTAANDSNRGDTRRFAGIISDADSLSFTFAAGPFTL